MELASKFKAAIVAVLLFVATSLVIVGSMVSASATSPCTGPIYWKANHWYKQQTTQSLTYDPNGPLYEWQSWHYHAIMRYWYCPRGDQTDLVQFEAMVFCAMKGDNNEAVNMRGFKWDPYINNDNNMETNPPTASSTWQLGAGNTGDEHCWEQDFTDSPWLWRTTDPYWKLTAWVNLAFQPDDEVLFGGGGNKFLGYASDPDVF